MRESKNLDPVNHGHRLTFLRGRVSTKALPPLQNHLFLEGLKRAISTARFKPLQGAFWQVFGTALKDTADGPNINPQFFGPATWSR